jgi:cation-transporting ATPase E
VAKSAFAAFLILTIGTTATAYPLLPRHLSLVAALTVGVPTFLLALAPSSGPWRLDHFGREVARFAVPAGVMAGIGVVASYLFALNALDFSVGQARTVAASVLVIAGLYLVIALEGVRGRRGTAVSAGCAVLGTFYALVLALAPTRRFFELAAMTPGMALTVAGGAAVALFGLYLAGFAPARDES